MFVRPVISNFAAPEEKERAHALAEQYGLRVEDFGLPLSTRSLFSVGLRDDEVRLLADIARDHAMTRTHLVRGMIRRCLREMAAAGAAEAAE